MSTIKIEPISSGGGSSTDISNIELEFMYSNNNPNNSSRIYSVYKHNAQSSNSCRNSKRN